MSRIVVVCAVIAFFYVTLGHPIQLAHDDMHEGAMRKRGEWMPELHMGTLKISNKTSNCRHSHVYIPHLTYVNDYSNVIQRAMKTMNTTGGGVVVLESGIYFLNQPLEVTSNTCVVGAGSGKTFLKILDRSWNSQTPGILRVNRAEHVSLIGFTLDGNRYNQHAVHQPVLGHDGIDVFLSNNVVIDDVGVFDVHGNAVNLRGNQNRTVNNITLEGVHLAGSGGAGVYMNNAASVTIVGSTLTYNRLHAIALRKSFNITVMNTSIKMTDAKWNACGVYCTSTVHSVRIDGVEILGSPRAGICSQGTDIIMNSSLVMNMDLTNSSCFAVENRAQFGFFSSTCQIPSNRTFES